MPIETVLRGGGYSVSGSLELIRLRPAGAAAPSRQLPPGSYRLVARYRAEREATDPIRWVGRLESNEIAFTILPPGEEPDLSEPFVLKKGSTMEDLAGKVHKDFLIHFKSARIWGSGAYEGQMVGRDHVLQEGDIVELRI